MLDLKTMGENIRLERINQSFTQEVLAEKAGMSDNYLSKIERVAGTASLQTIYNIARSLNVSIDYLIGHREYNAEYKFISGIIEINKLDEKNKEIFVDFINSNIKYFKQLQGGG